MKKSVKIISFLIVFVTTVLIVLWQIFLAKTTSFYLVAVIVLVLSMFPFFLCFEKSMPSAREMSLLGVLIALAVVSRAVFYLVPQFKPVAAVVIVAAVCLGAERGYIIGAFTAFISNFIFGQGIWTPFQMVALGVVGFVAGLIFKKVKANRWNLSIIGAVLVFFFYGFIVDLSSVLTMVTDYSFASVLAIYVAGVPFNAVFAGSTFLFLFIFGETFVKKINRINTKYGIVKIDNKSV